MKIAILHHDLEWTEQEFIKVFKDRGIEVKEFDIREPIDMQNLKHYDIILNRVYASVANRDYHSNKQAIEFLEELENEGITCLNSVRATKADYYKHHAIRLQEEAGLLAPVTKIVSTYEEALEIAQELEYPVIMKRNTGGRGLGVQKIDDELELMEYFEDMIDYGGDYIIQAYLYSTLTHDFRVTIINGEVVFAYTRELLSVKEGEEPWLASVSRGSKRKICEPPKEVLEIALEGASAIDAFYDSIDIMITQHGPVIVEHNPTPNYSKEPNEIGMSEKLVAIIVDKIIAYLNDKQETRATEDTTQLLYV